MDVSKPIFSLIVFWLLLGVFNLHLTASVPVDDNRRHLTTSVSVDVSKGHKISPVFFGIFFEEINHAGAGGLWAELVSNTGFEAGGHSMPSSINPWARIGEDEDIYIVTELVSCFKHNPVALRMDVLCEQSTCPPGGVGLYNTGYWGMNIEEGKSYRVIFYLKSTQQIDAFVAFVSEDGTRTLAFQHITVDAAIVKKWTKIEITLKARGSYKTARLQFTTSQKGTIWLDQVSAMPIDTYKGHGFRNDLMEMLLNLKPRFLRFPGGCYVQGKYLRNAFRWKDTVGPWEERPGHFNDIWGYWSDDGLGYLEYLQLAEDLDAEPVWVINNGIGTSEQIDTSLIAPFVQEMLDSVEFARGSPNSTWGSLRAKLGHPKPFKLNYIAFGNEGCYFDTYRGNYLKFYNTLKKIHPDIKVISNCDATLKPLDHPADIYDYHTYPNNTSEMLQLTNLFGKIRRDSGTPKAFVSEYAVRYTEGPMMNGTFGAALAEAAFLLSLEQNSDVEMVSYAPLFLNLNNYNKSWIPDAISFNTYQVYGIASYWVQTFFQNSSGATPLSVRLHNHFKPKNTFITAISWTTNEKKSHIMIKVVNYNDESLKLNISLNGVDSNSIIIWREVVLASDDLQADNTFENPVKVVPLSRILNSKVEKDILVEVQPYSLTAFDLITSKALQ